ncbi:MAG TPA: glutamate--tRNA ligase [Rhizomicrobium sp.]
MTTVRFAPSPTGLLHVGNARTAILNALFAKKNGGKFLLRIDDTDAARSTVEFASAIEADLSWLGIAWDGLIRQSERTEIYHAAVQKLTAAGRLYPAYETEEELSRQRSLLAARKLPPVYNRAALDPANAGKWEGRKPHYRFKLSRSKVAWTDLIRGPVEIDTATMSDPVLLREDGPFLYTLPSVADDIAMGISHVVRGEDHVTNTAAQIEIFQALGVTPPAFAHHPLLVGAGGEALSKRLGSLSLRQLREEGIEPLALASYLAKIGTSDAVEPRLTLAALAEECDFARIGRAPAHFDPAELATLNAKLLHITPYGDVAARLTALGVGGFEAFWEAARPNLTRLSDAAGLWTLVTGPVTPVIGDAAFATHAAALLPPAPWDAETWGLWTKAVAAETGAKGRALFHPLRLALTGLEHGPELKKLLPLIGRAKALARLKGETA